MDRQQSLDVRRRRRAAMGGQRERLVRPGPAELAAFSRGYPTDGHEDDGERQALALRHRQLELLRLQS